MKIQYHFVNAVKSKDVDRLVSVDLSACEAPDNVNNN